jgi:hypothetical protein
MAREDIYKVARALPRDLSRVRRAQLPKYPLPTVFNMNEAKREYCKPTLKKIKQDSGLGER